LIDQSIKQPGKSLTWGRANERFAALAGGKAPELKVTFDEAEQLRDAVRFDDPWDAAKKVGLAHLPPNAPTKAGIALLADLRALNIYVIETGELESFDKRGPKNKAEWLAYAMGRDLASEPAYEKARELVSDVFALSGLSSIKAPKAVPKEEPPKPEDKPASKALTAGVRLKIYWTHLIWPLWREFRWPLFYIFCLLSYSHWVAECTARQVVRESAAEAAAMKHKTADAGDDARR
jgi:hypothetical protein